MQTRYQDSVIGGWTRSLFMWIRECESNEKREDQKKKIFSSEISTNSGFYLKILAIFHEFQSEDQKKRFSVPKCPQIFVVILQFSTISKVKTKKKKSSFSTCHEIRCESSKTTKKQFLLANSRAISTNLGVLGLDLHSSSPEPVNFFGAQSSLGGAQAVIWGALPRMPPWHRACKDEH